MACTAVRASHHLLETPANRNFYVVKIFRNIAFILWETVTETFLLLGVQSVLLCVCVQWRGVLCQAQTASLHWSDDGETAHPLQ